MRALLAILLLAAPCALGAQVVDLRIEAAGTTTRVPGITAHGTTYYPVWALDRLGGTTVADAHGAHIALFDDTLVFRALSPFFTAGHAVHHLAFPVLRHSGIVHLPEQFFIEWLPGHHGARVEYRTGALRARGNVTARPAAARADDGGELRVVILDPGHGGRDHGRVGPGSLREKDVALRIAQRTAELLRERGYEVHLTRSTDTLIALADRPKLANSLRKGRPAAFVSIHANAAQDRSVRGFETFFLSDARTDDERRVAEMENSAVQFEGPSAANSELDAILNGLRNDFWVRASSDLAEVMQSDLALVNDGPDRGVKRAGFHVLVGALMPAVLVEVAFLSNAADAKLLGSQTFRDDVAAGIANSVHRFFESHSFLSAGSR
jgi:N-acetylmuramoyl-L-alanine amidase